ncbi:MAG: hypothetical protein JWN66_4832 [Sphingomonas bacterium]|uniref:hypothetical protein n=1 Tax=Sphingomonas bacterium TaxID=1895847 RepID=UPI002634871E|nr:hypothetical protein [Sphingomonas bacterium]MDB5707716.1 hypothetical protein [Sphingomonas bacterium]
MKALVSIRDVGQETVVTIPTFYPSGAVAAITVAEARQGFRVSDSGLAYHEADLVGADHLFGRSANAVAEQFGLDCINRSISIEVSADQLAGAIADVGAASVQIAHRIVERVASRNEAEIEAQLYLRLVHLFGAPKVAKDAEIAGASSHRWKVSALVTVDGRRLAFEAVSNHHSSVYSTATMFHDLSLLQQRPVGVAVVRDKRAMGDYLGILSQAANVIQDNVPDDAIAGLVAA